LQNLVSTLDAVALRCLRKTPNAILGPRMPVMVVVQLSKILPTGQFYVGMV